MKKIALFTVAVLALGAVVVPVSASALTAQEIIDALTADPTLFAALQAALGGGVTTGGAASGYFGPKTRGVIATLVSVPIVPSTVLPEGCASTSGFSATTGQPCTSTTLPAGCTSTAGFSPTTGQSCGGAATVPTGITTPGVEGTLAAT